MQQEISQYIAELLYKHSRLSIPGLGSLEVDYAPAALDQIQGQISAPAKDIRFNEHLVMDDGLLVNHLMERKGWTLEQSKTWVKEQVDQLKSSLERREIIELAGVGRFFKNFEHQLQFVAENSNFNTASFGLQAVTAQAVNHTIAERVTVPPPAVKTVSSELATKQPSSLKKNLWWFVLMAILLISLTIFLWILQQKTDEPIVNIDVPQERLNTSPSKKLNEPTDQLAAEGMKPEEKTDIQITEPEEKPEDIERAAAILAEEEQTAIIAVGLFGDQKNVQALLEKLTKKGFSPVTEIEGGMTRVGVSIRYEAESDLQKVLKEVQKDYTKSAFIMYQNGVRVK